MGGIRERHRADVTARIMATARAHLADVGAAGLSLRAIARDLDMVSSAVYRYVSSRDELLTLLILSAYDDLGDAADRASATSSNGDLERWVATARAVRTWARANPHDHLLLYGTPVPGYSAPTDTEGPGTRVARILVGIVHDAARCGRLNPVAENDVAADLSAELAALADAIDVELTSDVLLATIVGWTQMFGLLTFELTNQTRGVVTGHGALFEASVTSTGRAIGLR